MISPGFAFAAAISSCSDFAAIEGCTASASAPVATSTIGVKLRSGS